MENTRPWIRLGAYAVWFQLFILVTFAISAGFTGIRPETALEAFDAFAIGELYGLLKDEILLTPMVGAYMITFPVLFLILRKQAPVAAGLSCLFSVVVAILYLDGGSSFSLMHLARLYNGTEDLAMKATYLAAGEAVINSNHWHSNSGFYSGILLQGSGVVMSWLLFKNNHFRKITGISGMIGNGMDLFQHLFTPWLPAVTAPIQMIMGPFYILWYIFLALDLSRIARKESLNEITI